VSKKFQIDRLVVLFRFVPFVDALVPFPPARARRAPRAPHALRVMADAALIGAIAPAPGASAEAAAGGGRAPDGTVFLRNGAAVPLEFAEEALRAQARPRGARGRRRARRGARLRCGH
jgi:hypothetical protein